jgi:hypothetical protein
MPASRHAMASIVAVSSLPVTATSVAWPPSADDVVGDVGGAADAVALVVEGDHRHRRFG